MAPGEIFTLPDPARTSASDGMEGARRGPGPAKASKGRPFHCIPSRGFRALSWPKLVALSFADARMATLRLSVLMIFVVPATGSTGSKTPTAKAN